MQVNTNFKRTVDSLRILEKLDELEDLKRGDVRVVFNNRSPDDQKLLKHLTRSLRKRRWWHMTPTIWKEVPRATLVSLSFMAYMYAILFGYV